MNKEKLKKQITDSAGNNLYTYAAHWIIVNRLKKQDRGIKIAQIALTALTTGGILTSIIAGIPWLSWVGGATSALALFLNLYTLNFNAAGEIKKHTDAANDLWDIREAYRSLLADFDILSDQEITAKRDELIAATSKVNKNYPDTDEKAFAKAKEDIDKYTFAPDEAEKLIS